MKTRDKMWASCGFISSVAASGPETIKGMKVTMGGKWKKASNSSKGQPPTTLEIKKTTLSLAHRGNLTPYD